MILYNCRKTKNKKLERGYIMEIGILVFFVLVLIVGWFMEETKIGNKLSDKLYDYFMKN